ncbi:MAG: hypothetical protein RJQ14_02945, partial [Marinoscillum sp.]
MSLTERLARAQGINNENPNKALAEEITKSQNTEAISELAQIIQSTRNLDTLSDALKVVESIGEADPKLASPTFEAVKPHLHHAANKIQWRAMSALSTFAQFFLDELYQDLPEILQLM